MDVGQVSGCSSYLFLKSCYCSGFETMTLSNSSSRLVSTAESSARTWVRTRNCLSLHSRNLEWSGGTVYRLSWSQKSSRCTTPCGRLNKEQMVRNLYFWSRILMTTQRATVHTFTPGSFHSEFPALSYAARSGAKRNFSSEILPSATLACTADHFCPSTWERQRLFGETYYLLLVCHFRKKTWSI